MRPLLLAVALAGCATPPDVPDEQVGYRVGLDDGEADNGERGTVKITEILWSGSVTDAGSWDPADVFVEIRNEGSKPVNLGGWFLELSGARVVTWRIPEHDQDLNVGEHRIVAARDDGCFPNPGWLLPELSFAYGDPLLLLLRDRDERLIEPAGHAVMEPFAGGYDLVVSRSMEKNELMFGGDGTRPESWHHATDAEVDLPNDDLVRSDCRARTLATPGRPNSPDYSGAFSNGSLE